jgi:hypothetical protein
MIVHRLKGYVGFFPMCLDRSDESHTMVGDRLMSNEQAQPPVNGIRWSQRDVPRAQETIYDYLFKIVKAWPPEDVLEEFRHLFIYHSNTTGSALLPALYEIVFANQEQEFRFTLKRSCYILINNWDINRNHDFIRQLIDLFSDSIVNRYTPSPTLKRLRTWLKNFIESQDFRELRLFASRYEDFESIHWSQRYASYLLVPQYANLENSAEQREAARALSKRLKERFKMELALYTARCQSDAVIQAQTYKNPTVLGDESLRLIKTIVARRGTFTHTNLANIFIKQTHNLSFLDFKRSLLEYLIYSIDANDVVVALKTQLTEKLNLLYVDYNEKLINDALLLRTSNRVIEYLTTENHKEPSYLFTLLLSQGSPLTLVILLLKIILMCRYARTHLESRVADLIRYYEGYAEHECQWVVNFFEIFNVTMAIYTENVEYNLVSMNDDQLDNQTNRLLDSYRIFSQMRNHEFLDGEIDESELAAIEAAIEKLDELDQLDE